jgi:MSHA pilin protein MshA
VRTVALKRIATIIYPELIVALVLVGVLSAFVQTRNAAREAGQRSIALAGLAGSVRSGAALAHSIWVSDGAGATTVAISDALTVQIDLVTGYPLANERGIHLLIPHLGGFDIAVNDAGDTFIYSVAGVPAAECSMTYRTGGASGALPTVTVTNSTNGGDCS